MKRTAGIVLALLAALTLDSCGGEEPITSVEKRDLHEMIETAAEHLKASKPFEALNEPQVPSPDTTAEFHRSTGNSLQLIGDSIVATTRNDTAEVLFTLTVRVDSVTRAAREAFVYLIRDSGKWNGTGAYVVEPGTLE